MKTTSPGGADLRSSGGLTGARPGAWQHCGVAGLIPIDEARRRVLEAVRPLPSEPVALAAARGRVLAEDLRSSVDVPPFDSSAMDGFAVVAGGAGELRVVGESRAGHPAEVAVSEGTAVRISTGARVPEGADAVVPVERTEGSDGVVVVPQTAVGANVRRAGEDVRAGELVLRAGTVLGPAEVAVIASLGRADVVCAVRPRAVLLLTGDELAEPGEPLAPGRIWSSNGYALAGQIAAAGAELAARETVPDEPGSTRAALERALRQADLVCVSGGVSVGPHDHVKDALAELGVAERFWGVRLKPGKPTWFGTADRGERRVLVFGLPGNPVSAMVTFHLFARPALVAMQGATPAPSRATAVLDEPVPCNPKREQAVRCRLRAERDGWHAVPTGEQGSHQLTSMLGADALVLIPAGEGEVPAGARAEIELLGPGAVA
jgi:molybdopterin molybdotransferase